MDTWTLHFSVIFCAFDTVLLITVIIELNTKETLQRPQSFGEKKAPVLCISQPYAENQSTALVRPTSIHTRFLLIFAGPYRAVYFRNSVE